MLYIQNWQRFESPHAFPQVINLLPLVQKLLYNQKHEPIYSSPEGINLHYIPYINKYLSLGEKRNHYGRMLQTNQGVLG